MEPRSADITRINSFVELLHTFQKVERIINVPGSDRWENDVEHSYLLAMTAWYLIDALGMTLDIGKTLRYALAHDLVEVYAGDTYAYTKNEALKASKHERERKAQMRIEKEFPEFPTLHDAIGAYEEKQDEEARFIYALDKLIPVITVFLQNGRTWKEADVAWDEVMDHKRSRIGDAPYIRDLFEQIVALMEHDKQKYFNR